MDSDSDIPKLFFETLGSEGPEAAMEVLGTAAFQDGLDREPSPRAAAYINNGEWDESRTLLALIPVTAASCFGLLSKVTTEQAEYTRFCGVADAQQCTANRHATKMLSDDQIKEGFFLQAGTSARQGLLYEIYFPFATEQGSPVTEGAAIALMDPSHPFRMSPGQWKFLHTLYQLGRVDTVSEDTDPDGNPAPAPAPAPAPGPAPGPAPVPPRVNVGALSADPAIDAILREFQARLCDVERRLRESDSSRADLNRSLEAKSREAEDLRAQLASQSEEIAGHRRNIGKLNFAMFHKEGDVARLRLKQYEQGEVLEKGKGIECHGVRFRNSRDFVAWFADRNPPLAIFMDAPAMLQAITPPVLSQEVSSRNRESQIKIKAATPLEQSLVTSFDTILPGVMVGNKKEATGGALECLKSYLKTYAVWDPPNMDEGVAKRLEDGVGTVSRRIEELRTLESGPDMDSEVTLVSVGLITDNVTFCHGLVAWSRKLYLELTRETAYSDKDIWYMLLECLATIFTELHNARSRVKDAAVVQPALYVWGMLQAWEIQHRYVTNNFQDDPALTGTFVRRVLLQGKNSEIQKSIESVKATQTAYEAQQRTTNGELAKLKKEQLGLEGRIKTLEKKL